MLIASARVRIADTSSTLALHSMIQETQVFVESAMARKEIGG
jgi:hypothetical protein